MQQTKTDGYAASKETALTETALETVTKVTRYSGDNLYHVVSGTTEKGEKGYAYVPINAKEKNIQFFKAEATIPKEEIVAQWQNDCSSCKLVKVNLAIDGEQPLWEITYVDQKNRYVFEYFSAENGESRQQFRLQRSLY